MALDNFQPYLFVSAGEQSNKFLTPAYADGIAQFQAQRAQDLTGLTVRIEGVQEGTGDPSPTNIRPISGRTGMTVTRSGKNLLKNTVGSQTAAGVTWTVNSDGTITANGTATADTQFRIDIGATDLPRETNLYFSGCPSGGSATKYNVYVWDLDTNARAKKWNNITAVDNDTGASANNELYLVSGHSYRVICRVMSGQTVSNLVFSPMIRAADASGTFEPYNGTSIPITWETEAGTVYGGTLDVVSGVLTVTHAAVQIKDKTWTYDATNTRFGAPFLPDIAIEATRRQLILCDAFAPFTEGGSVSSAPNNSIYNGGTDGRLYIKTDTATTAEDFVSTYGEYHIVFPLATPQTYQLTPTEVRTIAGFNQIYSDAGPVIDIKF